MKSIITTIREEIVDEIKLYDQNTIRYKIVRENGEIKKVLFYITRRVNMSSLFLINIGEYVRTTQCFKLAIEKLKAIIKMSTDLLAILEDGYENDK